MDTATMPTLPEPYDIETSLDPEARLKAAADGTAQAEALIEHYKAIRKESIDRLREQGWELADIAEVAKMSPSMVWRIHKGQRR